MWRTAPFPERAVQGYAVTRQSWREAPFSIIILFFYFFSVYMFTLEAICKLVHQGGSSPTAIHKTDSISKPFILFVHSLTSISQAEKYTHKELTKEKIFSWQSKGRSTQTIIQRIKKTKAFFVAASGRSICLKGGSWPDSLYISLPIQCRR